MQDSDACLKNKGPL